MSTYEKRSQELIKRARSKKINIWILKAVLDSVQETRKEPPFQTTFSKVLEKMSKLVSEGRISAVITRNLLSQYLIRIKKIYSLVNFTEPLGDSAVIKIPQHINTIEDLNKFTIIVDRAL